jgi:hypothetical protein
MKDLIANVMLIPILVAGAAFWIIAFHVVVWMFRTLNSVMGF